MDIVSATPKLIDIFSESRKLCAKRYFDQAIGLVEENIEKIDPRDRLSAWCYVFNLARAKGDTELAKKYILKIEAEDPTLFDAD